MLYWSCESKKIAHGSTCIRIYFLPMVFLLLSFVVLLVVRRHRSMISLFYHKIHTILFSTNQIKRETKSFISLECSFRNYKYMSCLYYNHWLIYIIRDIFSFPPTFTFFFLLRLINEHEHLSFTSTFFSTSLRIV